MLTARAPTNTEVSAVNCAVAVVALGYQTTISSGRSLCASGNVEAWKPIGLSSARAFVVRQVRNKAARAVFNVFIFLDQISSSG